MLLHLIYASVETVPFSADAMGDLVERSRTKNERRAVTSMLLHQQGTFLHAIEGEAATVLALFATICADPRHQQTQSLAEIEVSRRLFANQPMGFHETLEDEMELGDLDDAEHELSMRPDHLSWRACVALQLLTRFRS